MERYSTLDRTPPETGVEAGVEFKGAESHPEQTVQQNHSTQPANGSVSAALAAARAEASGAVASPVHFPGEDGGHSLAEMAQRDLDAALQLLTDRAQYITGATGAAIALRRSGKNDMLCRASTGSNAPELGALLSTEFGLSGESVRTRQPLRCDDAERDARVNREVCRQLGIASVVVMPVVNDDEVLGVFELFSGKANAFGERDLSAVQRLSEMVETAVRLAHAAEKLPEQLNMREISAPAVVVSAGAEEEILEDPMLEVQGVEDQEPVLEVAAEAAPPEVTEAIVAASPVAEAAKPVLAQAGAPQANPPQAESVPAPAETAPKKPLFWSAALNSVAESPKAAEPDQSHVPPVMRKLRKCQACGFPVSAGRLLCVECEDKKWRGTLRVSLAAARQAAIPAPAAPAAKPETGTLAATPQTAAVRGPVPLPQSASATDAVSKGAGQTSAALLGKESKEGAGQPVAAPDPPARETASRRGAQGLQDRSPVLVLSAGLEPSQSWLSANRYIIGALLAVAGIVAAIFLLR